MFKNNLAILFVEKQIQYIQKIQLVDLTNYKHVYGRSFMPQMVSALTVQMLLTDIIPTLSDGSWLYLFHFK